jgi:hypothetical protein
LHIRDEKVLAAELLNEPDVESQTCLRALPAQKIAVIGHSFTMGLHWSSAIEFCSHRYRHLQALRIQK